MILTGKTIPQLPQLSATTNTSLLPIQLLSTTYYSTVQDFIKSTPFGTFYQDLLPSSGNTFSIGSLSNKVKLFFVSSITSNNIVSSTITTTAITSTNANITSINSTSIGSAGITSTNINGTNASIANINSNSLSSSTFTTSTINVKDSNYFVTITSNTLDSNKSISLQNKNGTIALLDDITGNTIGSGASIFVSASSANLTFKSLSSSTPNNITVSASGDLITFSAKTFITGATNSNSGSSIFQSADTQTLSFRTLSSQTPSNLNISTNEGLVLFSGKTFITGATNNGSGTQVYQSGDTQTLSFRSLSSLTPNNITVSAIGDLITFSAKTFITGATNLGNGSGIFKSGDTQTLTFRTLSSTSESLLVVANGNDLITFTPRQKFSAAFSSMVTQNASVANTIYIMSAETTEHSNRITVVDKTKFTIQSAGTYNIQFSTQFEKTGNGSCTVDIWFRKNGNDIARSNSQIFMAKNSNDKLIASWNYVDVFTSNTDYFQIAWASTSNDVRILAVTGLTSPTRPDVPSLIVTMFEV